MIEFLNATIILLIPFFIIFLIVPAFKYMKIIMIFIQLIFSFTLVSKILYKKHSLYSAPTVKYTHSTNFLPIKSLYKTENEEGIPDISFNTMDDNKFSIIKTEEYSIQCLENYFISKDETCPLTDIIFNDRESSIYNDYIQVSDNVYFYYTNENKKGKLYKSFNYYEFEENKEDSLTNEEINKIARKELNKISNPILDMKHFIKFYDVICIFIIFFSLLISLFEDTRDRKCGVVRILNICFQLIILIIYIIRFTKFIKIKEFLFDNEDIYKNDSYFPNKFMNFVSAPLAISINIFIINILYFAFPNHYLCCKHQENDYKCQKDCFIAYYVSFYLLFKMIFEILDFVNDSKIFPIYDNIIYNWKINPIRNIQLSSYYEDSESFIRWKDYILKIERLRDFNYINIYSSSNTKLCGKDNLGNNL